MNTFNKQLEKDRAVFFNEFGELKSIDGEVMKVVMDSDIVNERPHLISVDNDLRAQGLFMSRITFFVYKETLGYTPEEGRLMHFDEVGGRGYPYTVSHVSEAMGIFEITIEANRT